MAKEMETSIDYIYGDNTAILWTSNIYDIPKMRKMCQENPEECMIKVDDGQIFQCLVPKSWFRLPRKPTKRNFTDEQRNAARERMKKARESNGN